MKRTKNKYLAFILLIIIDLGQFAREMLFPFNLIMDFLDPFIDDSTWNFLTKVSWMLTIFFLTIIILGWIYDLDSEREELEFEANLRKTKSKKRK